MYNHFVWYWYYQLALKEFRQEIIRRFLDIIFLRLGFKVFEVSRSPRGLKGDWNCLFSLHFFGTNSIPQGFQWLPVDKKYVFSALLLMNPLITYFTCPHFYPPSSHIDHCWLQDLGSGMNDSLWGNRHTMVDIFILFCCVMHGPLLVII